MLTDWLGQGAPGLPGSARKEHGSRSVSGIDRMAESLRREFSAPVGLLDVEQRYWRATAGAKASKFPPIDESLLEVAGSGGLRLGKVAVWHRRECPDLTWLVFPLTSPECPDLVGFAGFRPAASSENPASADSRTSDHVGASLWGPSCPEPAIRAWGQHVIRRLQNEEDNRSSVDHQGRQDEENDHVVIGRLIRRMKISEAPAKFQVLATNVARTSLGMAAVIWVPAEPIETVVSSGEFEPPHALGYRPFLPDAVSDSALLMNEVDPDSTLGRVSVRRFATVAGGTSGWLVAVNPIPDRSIGQPDVERMQYVASLIATQWSNARTYAELKELLFGIIRALTAAIDAKDPCTSGHSERVARISVRLAEQLGMTGQKRSDLYLAGLLHDVGKIGIDDQVLKKSGPLTPAEFSEIQGHVEIGVKILRDLKKLNHILPGVRHHHESLDGSGYPDHLSGDQIPIEARILAVADSFDAMSSDRPYRRRLSSDQIDAIFLKGRGIQWDSDVVDALFACRLDVDAIRSKGLGESLIGAVSVTLGRS